MSCKQASSTPCYLRTDEGLCIVERVEYGRGVGPDGGTATEIAAETTCRTLTAY
jgi:hypothetical protein